MIECKHCKNDTEKRKVVNRKPLEELPGDLSDGYKEFYCCNTIKTKRQAGWDHKGNKTYKYFEEECSNHILAKKRGVVS